jgi:hypothetical protein
MEYGKLINGNLTSPDATMAIENNWVSNPTDEQLMSIGYKVVNRTEQPTYNIATQYLTPIYNEDTTTITVNYQVKDAPIQLSKLEFRNKLTFNEKVALDNYELTIDAMPIDAATKAMRKAMIKTITKDFDAASFIDLKYPATIQGVQTFAAFGLLTAERVNEILEI